MAAAAVAAVAAVVALALALPSHPSHPSANHSSSHATKPSHRSSPSAVVSPSSSSTFSAMYSVSRARFTVGLDASGPCWVMATDAAKGTVVWTGTLSAGGQHAIPATAALTVQLGSSNVAVTLDGKPVQLPSGYRIPFNMTFRPR